MLHQLQSTVETEESRWKSRLSEKEGELEQVRKETEKLTKSNLALEESLKVVNSAEEVWCSFNVFECEMKDLRLFSKYNKPT